MRRLMRRKTSSKGGSEGRRTVARRCEMVMSVFRVCRMIRRASCQNENGQAPVSTHSLHGVEPMSPQASAPQA